MAMTESLEGPALPRESNEEDLGPASKRIKVDVFADSRDKLESRLIGVLSCVVCFDLPNGPIYQVHQSPLSYVSTQCLSIE